MALPALTCHTHTPMRLFGMAPLTCAFRKIGAAEQYGPRRAPVCSTQTCLRAYTTIKQAKIPESPLNISLGTILTRVPRRLQAEES